MKWNISDRYRNEATVTIFEGDCVEFLKQIPVGSAKLIVTSPPYNIGKSYEKRTTLQAYLASQRQTLELAVQILSSGGSLCWQVGNHVDAGEVFPLDVLLYPICVDLGLKLRNRIVWHFEHGLHCSRRFSGRHETILWFTKSDKYTFNLDPIRVPQKISREASLQRAATGRVHLQPAWEKPRRSLDYSER